MYNPLLKFINTGIVYNKVDSVGNLSAIREKVIHINNKTQPVKNNSGLSDFDKIRLTQLRVNRKIICAFTSWKKRITNCLPVFKNILAQSVKPDFIYLTLSSDEFVNKEADLPKDLLNFIYSNKSIVLNWVKENTKCMKKIFPILKYLNDDDIILSMDDDFMYPNDYIESRLVDYMNCRHPLNGAFKSHYLRVDLQIRPAFGACILLTKCMLNNYEKYLDSDVIKSNNDDTAISIILYLNKIYYGNVTKYDVNYLWKHCSYNCTEPSGKNNKYLNGNPLIDFHKNKLIEKFGTCDINKLFGILHESRIKYCTNYDNELLYNEWINLCKVNYDAYSVKEFGYGKEFLTNVLPSYLDDPTVDMLCYIDVDCFIPDFNKVEKLIRYYESSEFGIVGMPDGGQICHRCSNPNYPNLFFTIFDLNKLRKVRNSVSILDKNLNTKLDNITIKSSDKNYPRINIVRNDRMTPFGCMQGCNEPYYEVLAYFMNRGIKYAPINGDDAPEVDGDGATTVLTDNEGGVICYHTWFARCYGVDQYHTDRINKVINKIKANVKNSNLLIIGNDCKSAMLNVKLNNVPFNNPFTYSITNLSSIIEFINNRSTINYNSIKIEVKKDINNNRSVQVLVDNKLEFNYIHCIVKEANHTYNEFNKVFDCDNDAINYVKDSYLRRINRLNLTKNIDLIIIDTLLSTDFDKNEKLKELIHECEVNDIKLVLVCNSPTEEVNLRKYSNKLNLIYNVNRLPPEPFIVTNLTNIKNLLR